MRDSERNVDELELEELREFYKSVSHYIGSYLVWKVLQEYRELILSLSPGNDHCLYHFHNVDGINLLRKYESHLGDHGWGDELPHQNPYFYRPN
jgi:hypothetical protein